MDSQQKDSSKSAKSRVNPPATKFEFNSELNADFLKQSYRKNLEFGKKMFSVFLSTIEEDMNQLRQSMQDNDYKGIKDIAHKIKNNFIWVGLPRMSSKMHKIEEAARAQSVSVSIHYQSILEMFGTEHQLVQDEYQRICNFLN